MAGSESTTLIMLFFLLCSIGCCSSSTITIVNKWGYTVWPVIVSHNGTSPLATTGFALQPGESTVIAVPPNWSGRIWGRTFCYEDPTGRFSCVTGDCASSTVAESCAGGNAASPVTMAEFTLNGTGSGLDFFRVSLAYGYNLPMTAEALGRRRNCAVAGCTVDLNMACPVRLKVTSIRGEVVGCQSACQAFSDCKHNPYSQFFKSVCPYAYIDAYENDSFSCLSTDYLITFNAAAPSTSVMEPTAMVNTRDQSSSKIVVVIMVIIFTLFGGYVAYRVKLSCSNGLCGGECELGGGQNQIQPAQNPLPL